MEKSMKKKSRNPLTGMERLRWRPVSTPGAGPLGFGLKVPRITGLSAGAGALLRLLLTSCWKPGTGYPNPKRGGGGLEMMSEDGENGAGGEEG